MNKQPSLVEINGHRYDAFTGRIIGAAKKSRRQTKPGQGSIDGFMRTAAIIAPKPASAKRHAKRAIHSLRRSTQHSKTLMRNVVKRPNIKHRPKSRVTLKTRVLSHNHGRAARAGIIHKDPRVKRFGIMPAVGKRHQRKEVKEGEVIFRGGSASTMALSAAVPNISASSSHQRLERLLDYALAKADSHKQNLKRKKWGSAKLFKILPKWLNIVLLIALVASVAGLFVWQKLPQASLRLASSMAHVEAAIPDYVPEGFISAGPVKAENGIVFITYKAVNDSTRSYVLKEQASSDNNSVIIAKGNGQVQTTQNRGVSISIIKDGDKNKAVCSNGGRQTILEDNAGLPPSVINDILDDIC